MTKTNIAPGREFKFGSLPCIVLEAFEDDTVLVLAKESIGDYAFDEDNCNNFNKSSLRRVLNDDFLVKCFKDGADLDSMLDFTIDLTSEDGLKDYGKSTNRVALLTCDMYRRYRSIIPNLDNWWWTATPNSPVNPYVRDVSTGGDLNLSEACNGDNGVRPAFLLKSSIFESCHPDLAAFTFGEKEFEYLIDKYMGFDAVRYFRELVQNYEEQIEEAREYDGNE